MLSPNSDLCRNQNTLTSLTISAKQGGQRLLIPTHSCELAELECRAGPTESLQFFSQVISLFCTVGTVCSGRRENRGSKTLRSLVVEHFTRRQSAEFARHGDFTHQSILLVPFGTHTFVSTPLGPSKLSRLFSHKNRGEICLILNLEKSHLMNHRVRGPSCN